MALPVPVPVTVAGALPVALPVPVPVPMTGDMGSFGIVKERFEISPKNKGRHDHWIPSSEQNIIL